MMPIKHAAAIIALLWMSAVARGQEEPKATEPAGVTAPATAPSPRSSSLPTLSAPDRGDGSAAADGASEATVQILNADGSPAVGAKVVEGVPGKTPVIINGQLFEYSSPLKALRPISSWRETDQEGRLDVKRVQTVVNADSLPGALAMPPTMPALLALGDDDQVAFLPPESESATLQMRKAGQLTVKVQLPSGDVSTDYTVLAWWNNGYALPNQPSQLGYKQESTSLFPASWKFRSSFAVFQTAPLQADSSTADGLSYATAKLVAPPGEIRLTIIPTRELQSRPAQINTDARLDRTAVADELNISTSQLVDLALSGGPSKIVSVGSGEQETVQFEDCMHSIQLHMVPAMLPPWDTTSHSETVVMLIRQIILPGSDSEVVKLHTPIHESLLLKYRSLRSQLPRVRVANPTAGGTYRFDLLCPGTYQVRLGHHSKLQHIGLPDNYDRLGYAVSSRKTSGQSDDHAAIDGSPSIATFQLGVEPAGVNWSQHLVISANRQPTPSPVAPMAPGGHPAKPPADESISASAVSPAAPSAEPTQPDTTLRQKQIRELRARIRTLQQQLNAAIDLVDQLER